MGPRVGAGSPEGGPENDSEPSSVPVGSQEPPEHRDRGLEPDERQTYSKGVRKALYRDPEATSWGSAARRSTPIHGLDDGSRRDAGAISLCLTDAATISRRAWRRERERDPHVYLLSRLP